MEVPAGWGCSWEIESPTSSVPAPFQEHHLIASQLTQSLSTGLHLSPPIHLPEDSATSQMFSTLDFVEAQLNPELVCKAKCSLSGLQWPLFGGPPRPALNSAPVSINWSNITRGTDIAPVVIRK